MGSTAEDSITNDVESGSAPVLPRLIRKFKKKKISCYPCESVDYVTTKLED